MDRRVVAYLVFKTKKSIKNCPNAEVDDDEFESRNSRILQRATFEKHRYRRESVTYVAWL
jgi:hypothetical protein